MESLSASGIIMPRELAHADAEVVHGFLKFVLLDRYFLLRFR